MKPPNRACLKCGVAHWGPCSTQRQARPVDVPAVPIAPPKRPEPGSSAGKAPRPARFPGVGAPRPVTTKTRAVFAEIDEPAAPAAPDIVSGLYAPPGKCPSCDQRRAKVAAAVARHRAKKHLVEP